jgi:hypothetical protein
MEIKTEVKTYRVEMQCDRCKEGKMVPTRQVYLCSPPKYPHKCNSCEFLATYSKNYPYVSHEPILGS